MKKKDYGVLYIRYDKNTFCGQILEKRKKEPSRKLSSEILKLVFLSEIVEPMNLLNADLGILKEAYYQSLKLFSDKLSQAQYKLENLNKERTRQKNRESETLLSAENDLLNSIALLPARSTSENKD